MKYTTGTWRNEAIANYNWTSVNDDYRQVTTLNQFGLTLMDSSAFMPAFTGWQYQIMTVTDSYLVAFKDMIPEVARLLGDYVKADADIYINKIAAAKSDWYSSLTESYYGNEHGQVYPVDAYQLFLARSWIDKESPDNPRII